MFLFREELSNIERVVEEVIFSQHVFLFLERQELARHVDSFLVQQLALFLAAFDKERLAALDVLFVHFYLVNADYQVVFQVLLGLEDDEALLEAVFLSAGEVRLLEMLLETAVVAVESVAVFLVAEVTLQVLELQVRRKQVVVEEARITELVMLAYRAVRMVGHQVAALIKFTVTQMVFEGVWREEFLLVNSRCTVLQADLTDDSVVILLQVLLEQDESREPLGFVFTVLHWTFQCVDVVAKLLALFVDVVDSFLCKSAVYAVGRVVVKLDLAEIHRHISHENFVKLLVADGTLGVV